MPLARKQAAMVQPRPASRRAHGKAKVRRACPGRLPGTSLSAGAGARCQAAGGGSERLTLALLPQPTRAATLLLRVAAGLAPVAALFSAAQSHLGVGHGWVVWERSPEAVAQALQAVLGGGGEALAAMQAAVRGVAAGLDWGRSARRLLDAAVLPYV